MGKGGKGGVKRNSRPGAEQSKRSKRKRDSVPIIVAAKEKRTEIQNTVVDSHGYVDALTSLFSLPRVEAMANDPEISGVLANSACKFLGDGKKKCGKLNLEAILHSKEDSALSRQLAVLSTISSIPSILLGSMMAQQQVMHKEIMGCLERIAENAKQTGRGRQAKGKVPKMNSTMVFRALKKKGPFVCFCFFWCGAYHDKTHTCTNKTSR